MALNGVRPIKADMPSTSGPSIKLTKFAQQVLVKRRDTWIGLNRDEVSALNAQF
jgi:hypothetical protein